MALSKAEQPPPTLLVRKHAQPVRATRHPTIKHKTQVALRIIKQQEAQQPEVQQQIEALQPTMLQTLTDHPTIQLTAPQLNHQDRTATHSQLILHLVATAVPAHRVILRVAITEVHRAVHPVGHLIVAEAVLQVAVVDTVVAEAVVAEAEVVVVDQHVNTITKPSPIDNHQMIDT